MPVLPVSLDQLEKNNSFAGGKGTFKSGIMGFSGCDISATIRVPAYSRVGISGSQEMNQEKVFRIGTLQTISISTYNSKTPVKALGFKNPIAIARGGRTIAGTMIFNQLHKHVLDENDYGWWKLAEDKGGLLTYSSGNPDYYTHSGSIEKLKEDMLTISKTGDLEKYTATQNFINSEQQDIDSENRVNIDTFRAIKDPTPEDKFKFKNEQDNTAGRLRAIEEKQDAEYARQALQYSHYHELRRILEKGAQDKEYARKEWDFSWDGPQIGDKLKPSDILPFDIIILLFNEAGNMGKIILYGVEIVHDSMTLSVEDIYTEVQYQYIARDIVYFEDIYGSHEKDFNFTNARGRKIHSTAMKVHDTRNPEGTYNGTIPLVTDAQKEAAVEAALAEARRAPIASNLSAAERVAAEKINAETIKKLEDQRQEFSNAAMLREEQQTQAAVDFLESGKGASLMRADELGTVDQLKRTDYKTNAEYQAALEARQKKVNEDYTKRTQSIIDKHQKEFEELQKILKADGYSL